jgi:uncharacterized DUF497 family protein
MVTSRQLAIRFAWDEKKNAQNLRKDDMSFDD